MTHWFVDESVEHPDRRCVHCGHLLAWVDEVGWVSTESGDSYDMCAGDAFGNHLARPLEDAPA